MRTKAFAITIIGLLALFLVLVNAAFVESSSAQERPTPTPEVAPLGDLPSAPASPDALPDLIVQSIQLDPPDPFVGRDTTVYVTIKNIGAADVGMTNNFFLDLYINPPTDQLRGIPGDVYWGVQGYWMKAGATVILTQTLTDVFTDAVSYNLWAQIDTPDLPPPRPMGWVLESDEDNNIFGPRNVHGRTHFAWIQKDHVDFFQNMASTLDIVPAMGTVGIITNTPALELGGDSALVLGIFQEPPPPITWGLTPTVPNDEIFDYNMMYPDIVYTDTACFDPVCTDKQLNQEVEQYQVFSAVAAHDNLVVAVWEDGRNGPTYGRDIFLRWSNDSGDTWKDEFRVNDVERNDQRHPAVSVAPNGRIVVAWQDHRDASFDIYTQAFLHLGDELVWCDKDGACSSGSQCDPSSEDGCNRRVDTDANNQDQILPDIDVDDENHFYMAWQDRRNGNDDIFAVRSYYSESPCDTTRRTWAAASDTGLSPEQEDYLCWADDTRIDDDPSTTKQSAPSINALTGLKILDILYELIWIAPDVPPIIEVTDVIAEPTTYVAAVWEDWREGDADIYFTYSDDYGETFAVDKRLNRDKADNTSNRVDQLAPDVAISNWMKQIELRKPTQYGEATGQVRVPVTTMQIVWQDFRNSTDAAKSNNPDIFHTAITVQPDSEWPWPIMLTYEGEQQVNSNDDRAWQTQPVWQGEPRVDATGSALLLEDSEGWNAYIVWADGRNYGGEFGNTDIYFQFLSNVGDEQGLIPGNNVVLNNGARLHSFAPADYSQYRRDMPPHARQRNPGIASTLLVDWPTVYHPGAYDPYIYVVWDDDRRADPFFDRDVYLARTNLRYGGRWDLFNNPNANPPGEGEYYGSGAFISQVFDSGRPDTTWYIMDWHATTDLGTYITLQTRLGNTRAEVLSSEWYPKRFPYPDDALNQGSPLQGYDAPGQHIEDANGNYWPQARYIQYRVNFWARDALSGGGVKLNTPFLFDVILHYERPLEIYLPLVRH